MNKPIELTEEEKEIMEEIDSYLSVSTEKKQQLR